MLVNNAGNLRNAPFESMTDDEFRSVLDVHLGGTFSVTQAVYRHMRAAGYGRIVFTSSTAGMFASPWQANYAAAKAGIVGLGNVVALEGAEHGILANTILPMALTGIGSGGAPPYPPDVLEETLAALRPLLSTMTTEHVVPLVVYLASPACAQTGHVYSVGCGHVARVFVAMTRGWHTTGPTTPEEVAAHLGTANDLTEYAVPRSMNDATRFIAANRPEAVTPVPDADPRSTP